MLFCVNEAHRSVTDLFSQYLDHKEGDEGGVSFNQSFECNSPFTNAVSNELVADEQTNATSLPNESNWLSAEGHKTSISDDETDDTKDAAQLPNITIEQIRNNVANDIRSPKDKPILIRESLRERDLSREGAAVGTENSSSINDMNTHNCDSRNYNDVTTASAELRSVSQSGSQSGSQSDEFDSLSGSQSEESEDSTEGDRRKTFTTPKPSRTLQRLRTEITNSTGKVPAKGKVESVTFATPPLPRTAAMPTRASTKKMRDTPKPVTPKSRFQPVRKSTAK